MRRASTDRARAARPLLRQHHDRPALGGLVRERRQLRSIGKHALSDAWQREELGRLTIAERDRAGLVEEQRVHVAGRFDRSPGHGQHVVPHQSIHAGNADRRQQAADRRRNQADEQRDQHEERLRRAGVDASGCSVTTAIRRDHGEAEEQDVERDFVRCLLPLGALDERRSSGR